MRWALMLGLVAAGCRVHTLEDGRYTFTVTETIADDCGDGFDRTVGPGTLRTSGNRVLLALERPRAELSGEYRELTEEMVLDGTSTMVPVTVRGRGCVAGSVEVHMLTSTVSPARFTAEVAVTVRPATDSSCGCQWWYRAAADASSN